MLHAPKGWSTACFYASSQMTIESQHGLTAFSWTCSKMSPTASRHELPLLRDGFFLRSPINKKALQKTPISRPLSRRILEFPDAARLQPLVAVGSLELINVT